VHDPILKPHRACYVAVAAELDARGDAVVEDTDRDSSIKVVVHVCQEVRCLLAKVHSTLEHVRDMVVPKSMSITTTSIVEALVLKDDGEDPMVVVVHR
jgi:hypothetical protein